MMLDPAGVLDEAKMEVEWRWIWTAMKVERDNYKVSRSLFGSLINFEQVHRVVMRIIPKGENRDGLYTKKWVGRTSEVKHAND